jgi:tetratricopeptide (TPR) repeat protein
MKITSIPLLACATLIGLLSAPPKALAQDNLAAARDLYASAAYEDALMVLNKIEPGQPSDRLAVNQYRSFCLLALKRNVEAEQAIEAVLADEPAYAPSEAEASPRLLQAFASVRQRILPAVVQRTYAHAKASFDHQEFAAAAAEFSQVLKMLDDGGLGDATGRPPLKVEAPAPTVAVANPNRVYNTGEAQVVPPVMLRQELPPLPRDLVFHRQGVLEVIINEAGMVETATMRSPIDPRYDAMVITATRQWKYQPATVGGTPVKFRKIIGVRTQAN